MKVFAIGSNDIGQLSDAVQTLETTLNLVEINLNFKIKLIAMGYFHVLIVTENNELYGTGKNKEGQLGIGDDNNRNSFTKIDVSFLNNSEITSIECAGYFSILLTKDNNLFVTGQNFNGQLGLDGNDYINKFTKNNNFTFGNIKKIKCGVLTTVVMNQNGEFFYCGADFENRTYSQKSGFTKFYYNVDIIDFKCGKGEILFLDKYNQLFYIGGNIINAIKLITPGTVKEINFHYTKLTMTNERNEIYLIKQENLKTHFEQLKVTVKLKKVFSGLSNKIYFISKENELYSVETEGKKLEKLKSKTSLSQQFIYTFSGFNFAYVITSHSALFVNGFSSEEVDRMKKLLFNQLKSVNNRFRDVCFE